FSLLIISPPSSTLFPYTTLFRSIYHLCDTTDWINVQVDMTQYAGQTVRIKFLVHQDGFNPPGDTTGQWVDDVALYTPCGTPTPRSEEHTSELQSRFDLVCRLLLE